MNLYHGSIVEVRNPKIMASKSRGLDFGNGFYTTTNKEQALTFLKFSTLGSKAIICSYSISGN
ncbi:MAG: DUF3990 domain-containing protein [Fibromonadaceae bacterium]|jgi:hypothetical protein|nr:DUF3990 domain-containing protein [Fibromonadaceae bacterium]